MCSSYYFNANSFKRNMIFSYSVLHYFQICKTFVLYFGKVEPLITENQLLFAFQTFVFTIFEGK